MNLITISIGQAGNQINYELTKIINNYNEINYSTFGTNLYKSILIDSEHKVIENILQKDDFLNTKFQKNVNVFLNNNGRGNNWSLGYSIDYKEYKSETNFVIESYEKINKFIEKCDFIEGFTFIHSINGGSGSGITTRLIELLRDEYSKFIIIDCPVLGFECTTI